MDPLCFGKTADASDFYVEDAAGANLERKIRIARVANRFIEADRGLDRLLQARMQIDFIVPQRLLNHEQFEGVEFSQVLNLVKRVGRIRVHTEKNIGPPRTNLLQNIQVPSRLDLDLDSPVAGSQFGLDLLQELVWRVLDADRNTACNFLPRTSKQFPERLLFLSGLRIPNGIFESRFGHPMAAHFGKERGTVAPGMHLRLQQRGSQVVLDGRPGGLDPFRAVKRIFPRDALAPAAHTLRL